MSMYELFSRLNSQGITLELDNDELEVNAPGSKLTPALLSELKEKKEEIITFLKNHIQKQEKFISIEAAEKKEYYALSSAQKSLYVLQQLNLDSTAYNIPVIIPLPEDVNIRNLKESFKKLIKRHDSLRTSFHMVNDALAQRIHNYVEFGIEYYNLSTDYTDYTDDKKDTKSKEGQTEVFGSTFFQKGGPEAIIKSFIRPFDLSNAPLMRVGLLKTGEGGHLLLVNMHHIITDGTSHEVLKRDFMRLYNGEELPSLRIQYKDFAVWQNSDKEKDKLKQQEVYWLKEFEGEIPVLNIPTDYPRPAIQSFEGNNIDFEITHENTRSINEYAREQGVTLYMMLLAIVNILLSKLSGQEDIVVGTPITGRRHADLEKIIGMFVNTLSLRNYPAVDRTFREFLGEVKERTLMAFENQEYPFEELVDKLSVTRDIGRNPLFDVMFVLQNMNTGSVVQDKETEIETSRPVQPDFLKEYENIVQTAKFDITINAEEIGRGLFLSFQYCTKLFKKETIERFISYFKKIVSIAVKEPGIRISGIEIISEEEKNLILNDFNKTEAEYPKDKTIHRLFEEQVEQTPDNIAVIGPSVLPIHKASLQITYKELNEKSNRLAYVLQLKGMGTDNIVGIMVERSVEMIFGILGILKSGGAYLPLDPDYPKNRINYMLKDSGEAILLTENELSDFPSSSYSTSTLTSTCQVSPTNLAYIIYTSGTTGKPKGVLIQHGNVVRLMFNDKFQFDFSENDVWTLFHSFCFDFSVWEMYGALLYGGKLVIVPKMVARDTEGFLELLKVNQVTILNQTPSAFYNLVNLELQNPKRELNTRYIIFGGETLTPAWLKEWKTAFPAAQLINMYGITETTVHVTFKKITDREIGSNTNNIGQPIPTLSTYLVDRNLKLVPIGVPGELFVGGAGVGRGYLNRPELSSERFINYKLLMTNKKEPFGQPMQSCIHASMQYHSPCQYPITPPPHSPHSPYSTYSTIYRSGDLARWLVDGELEYLGRIDQQVKIRGFRIELGEIESQLSGHIEIDQAVVILKEDQNPDESPSAYFVSRRAIPVSELRDHLLKVLPDYMIPSYFVQMEKIPLTSNGKIDRRALPKPGLKVGESYTAPRNEIEKKLVALWAEILGRDQLHTTQLKTSIGIDDNFFQLGGHSLNATILAARIFKEFEIQISLVEFFKIPTIRELAKYLHRTERDKFVSIEPVEKKEYYALSSAQKRLYIMQKIEEKNTAYNMPYILSLGENINKDRLEETFRKLISRHESLRTSFEIVHKIPIQKVHDDVEFEIEYDRSLVNGHWSLVNCQGRGEVLSPIKVKKIIREFIRPFDLSQAPLLRVGLIRKEDEKHMLMIDMHHIITDGVSQDILRKEFSQLYFGETLYPFRLQYKEYSEWQQSREVQITLKKQEEYWLKVFAGDIPILSILTDFQRPLVKSYEGNKLYFEIDIDEARALKKLSKEADCTIFILLLAIYNIFLSKISGQDDIIIGTSAAGRSHADLGNVIGMFVNTLALRNYPKGDKTFIEFTREVKERSLAAFSNQDYQFDDLVEKVVKRKNGSRNPLFDVRFIMENVGPSPDISESILVEPVEFENLTSKFDLTLNAFEAREMLGFRFEYCTKLFKKETIGRFIDDFKEIVSIVIKDREIKLRDITISHEFVTVKLKISQAELEF